MTAANREQLVLTHIQLVVRIAGREAKRLPSCVDMDELIAAGNLGLCQAADKFDPRLHASFAVFASTYIRGRIIDNFRGPRYPRRWETIPDEWLGSQQRQSGDGRDDAQSKAPEQNHQRRIPAALIDNTSVLDLLIEKEACVVVSIDAFRARQVLTEQEGKVVDKHLSGQRLTLIGAKHKKSAAWAHTTLKRAKEKMRAELVPVREAA